MSAPRGTQRGQAATEYLLLLALVAVVLGIGADAPVMQLVEAIATRYQRFVGAVSLP
jgi:Flp pilus assembly pilin Flp